MHERTIEKHCRECEKIQWKWTKIDFFRLLALAKRIYAKLRKIDIAAQTWESRTLNNYATTSNTHNERSLKSKCIWVRVCASVRACTRIRKEWERINVINTNWKRTNEKDNDHTIRNEGRLKCEWRRRASEKLHMWVGRCGDSITGPEMILVPVYFYFEEKIVKNKFSSSIREFDWTISESEFFVRLCLLLSLLFDLAVFFLSLLANNPCRTNIRNRRMPLWHGTADQWNRSAMTAIRSTNKKAKNGKKTQNQTKFISN